MRPPNSSFSRPFHGTAPGASAKQRLVYRPWQPIFRAYRKSAGTEWRRLMRHPAIHHQFIVISPGQARAIGKDLTTDQFIKIKFLLGIPHLPAFKSAPFFHADRKGGIPMLSFLCFVNRNLSKFINVKIRNTYFFERPVMEFSAIRLIHGRARRHAAYPAYYLVTRKL